MSEHEGDEKKRPERSLWGFARKEGIMGGRGSSSSLGKSRYKIGEPMSDKHIAKAEALGLKRWSRGGMIACI